MILKISDNNVGYLVVFGGFLIHLSVGSYYISGGIQELIIKYSPNNTVHFDHNISKWLAGSIVLGMESAISLGGFMEMKIGPKLTVLIGGWFSSLSICLMYFMINTNWTIIVITFGLFSGIGAGIAYGVALGTSIKWFPRRKGIVLGIISSGFGLSSGIFFPIQKSIVVHDKKMLPWSFLIMGVIFAILQLFGSILLKKNKTEENKINSDQILFLENVQAEMKPYNIIYVIDFWILWLIMCVNKISSIIITSLYLEFFDFIHISDNYKQNIRSNFVTVTAVSMFLGKIFSGFFMEIVTIKKALFILNLLTSIFIATFSLLQFIRGQPIIYIYPIWLVIINLCGTGNFTILSTICADLFGMKYFIINYGMILTACSVGGMIISLILTYSQRSLEFYVKMFIIGGVLSFIAGILALLYRGSPKIIHSEQF